MPWKITAERAHLDIGGYGRARNSTFEVMGVPVLWFPYMIYPLKSDRATGFLFPVVTENDGSAEIVLEPF